MATAFAEVLERAAQDAGMPLTPAQLRRFSRYHDLLLVANARVNLTAITDLLCWVTARGGWPAR